MKWTCLLPLLLISCSDESRRSEISTATEDDKELASARALPTENGLSQYSIAKIYAERAKEDPKQFPLFLQYAEEAAAKGNTEAQTALAALYFYGTEVPRDIKKAQALFEEILKKNKKQAHYYLWLIEKEQGNNDKAEQQLQAAAIAGIDQAETVLGQRALQRKDIPAALLWLQKAAKQRSATAALLLGTLYAKGEGDALLPDITQAAHWYKRAAELGDPKGQYITALMLIEGEGITKSPILGLDMLKLSAGQDYLPAIQILIQCYNNGIGTAKDETSAQAWQNRLTELQKKE